MRKTAFGILLLAMGVIAAAGLAQEPPDAEPRFEPVRVLEASEAIYPVNSIAAGTVVLEVTISPSGEIEDVKVVKGIASLTEPARRAVREWRFAPARLEGRPVRSVATVAFTFNRPVLHPARLARP
jgi:TonB family protein